MSHRPTPAQFQRAAAAQAPLNIEALADLRRNRGVEKLCRLGPRVIGELLNAIGAECAVGTTIDRLVEKFAQLDPATVAALGADQFPSAPLMVIRGGRDDGAPVRRDDAGVTKGNRITEANRRDAK